MGIGLRGGCHGTFIRLWRNDGHNRHAGLLPTTGAHLVNPVVELGNLSIKRGDALLQRAQSVVGFTQQLLVGFAGRFGPTHLV